jgi:hypothetical protein
MYYKPTLKNENINIYIYKKKILRKLKKKPSNNKTKQKKSKYTSNKTSDNNWN